MLRFCFKCRRKSVADYGPDKTNPMHVFRMSWRVCRASRARARRIVLMRAVGPNICERMPLNWKFNDKITARNMIFWCFKVIKLIMNATCASKLLITSSKLHCFGFIVGRFDSLVIDNCGPSHRRDDVETNLVLCTIWKRTFGCFIDGLETMKQFNYTDINFTLSALKMFEYFSSGNCYVFLEM